ncbi:peroxiredoxin family protein [Planomicrobium okeanokoites]|uniref:peroxiredoxin family protein n=1 Tax=Planomicrobium okeanokoites TaxID=244 RepID=UPI002491FBE9|nr:redoxin domain-containing protein [Planomicrobium okeanokoites]
MKKWILGFIIAAMIGWAAYDFLSPAEETAQETTIDVSQEENQSATESVPAETTGLAVGDIAPDFELATMDGETIRLSELRGQRVFVNFWATWCPPCRAEMPDMQQLYEEQDIPFEILAVNLTESEQNEQNIASFVEDFNLSFPILLDMDSTIAEKYQVKAVPASYMIDTEGRIAFVAPGAMHYDMMAQEIKKMN